MKRGGGFTLVELLVFLAVLGIISELFTITFRMLHRGSSNTNQQNLTLQTAKSCLERYLGERALQGFNSSMLALGTYPSPSFCATLPGYKVSVAIEPEVIAGDASSYRKITVVVAPDGIQDFLTARTEVSTIIADYSNEQPKTGFGFYTN